MLNNSNSIDEIPEISRNIITFISILLVIAGCLDTCIALIVLRETYYGSWYAGGASVILGILRLRFIKLKIRSRRRLKCMILISTICGILCLAGTSIDWTEYNQVIPLQSCATSSTSYSYSCSVNSSKEYLYLCVGKTDGYQNALNCAVNSINTVGDPSICSCVSSPNSQCFSFDYTPSCSFILNQFPAFLCISFSLTLLCLILSVIILCLAVKYGYYYNPTPIATPERNEYIDPFTMRTVNLTHQNLPRPTKAEIDYIAVIEPDHLLPSTTESEFKEKDRIIAQSVHVNLPNVNTQSSSIHILSGNPFYIDQA